MMIARVQYEDDARSRKTAIRSYPIVIQKGSVFEAKLHGRWIAVRVLRVKVTMFTNIYVIEDIPC